MAGDFCVVMGNDTSCNNSGIKTGERCIVKNNVTNDNETIGISVAVGKLSGVNVAQSNTAKTTGACFSQDIGIQVNCTPGLRLSIVRDNKASSYDPPELDITLPTHQVARALRRTTSSTRSSR